MTNSESFKYKRAILQEKHQIQIQKTVNTLSEEIKD